LTTAKNGCYTVAGIGSLSRNIFRHTNGGCADGGAIYSRNNLKERRPMNDSNDGLEQLYQDYWLVHSQKLQDHRPVEVAAVLMAQAMTLYKTVLDDKDYNKMIDDIGRKRNQVKALTPDQGHFH
jgi:hypothetical protein